METEQKPKNHNNRAQCGCKFSEIILAVFNELSATEFADNPNITDKEIIEHLCKFYKTNSIEKAKLQEKVEVLENQLQELQVENTNLADAAQSSVDNSDVELQNLRTQVEELEARAGIDAETISKLTKEKEDAQRMANTNAQELTKMTLASENPEKGKYLVEFGDVAREIMDLTLSRLREKLNKPELTANILLTDLFVKYTKTRNHFGSFPTQVTGEEIRMITKKYE
ncbi:MAG: hypothetical protein FWC39_07380 [Bacteroidetes bacterium]|nr:hypothetical protein [Bacteroidota bacterium]